MAKRTATSELNHENWNVEDEPEEAGVFVPASTEVLRERKIIKPKRRIPPGGAGAQKSEAAAAGAGPAVAAPSSNPFATFSFANAFGPTTTTTGTGTISTSETAPEPTPSTNNSNPFAGFTGFTSATTSTNALEDSSNSNPDKVLISSSAIGENGESESTNDVGKEGGREESGDSDEPGQFKQATPEQMSSRVIVKAKRSLGKQDNEVASSEDSASTSNPFSGFTFGAPAPEADSNPSSTFNEASPAAPDPANFSFATGKPFEPESTDRPTPSSNEIEGESTGTGDNVLSCESNSNSFACEPDSTYDKKDTNATSGSGEIADAEESSTSEQ